MKRDVRASIGAYGGGNGAYERVFTEKAFFQKHCKIQCLKGGHENHLTPNLFRSRGKTVVSTPRRCGLRKVERYIRLGAGPGKD